MTELTKRCLQHCGTVAAGKEVNFEKRTVVDFYVTLIPEAIEKHFDD